MHHAGENFIKVQNVKNIINDYAIINLKILQKRFPFLIYKCKLQNCRQNLLTNREINM